jgi:hypothetical protein
MFTSTKIEIQHSDMMKTANCSPFSRFSKSSRNPTFIFQQCLINIKLKTANFLLSQFHAICSANKRMKKSVRNSLKVPQLICKNVATLLFHIN